MPLPGRWWLVPADNLHRGLQGAPKKKKKKRRTYLPAFF
jgi:hypothetical protein